MGMRKLSRRDFLRLSAVSITGAMAVACQASPTPTPTEERVGERGGEEKPSKPAGKVQLIYQDWADESYPLAWQEVGHVFTDAHPDIEVKYLGRTEDYLGKLLAQLVTGVAPDLFETCRADWRLLWKTGTLLALDSYVEETISEEEMKDFSASQIKFWQAPDTDELYGWPKYQGNLAIFINLEMADQAGASYPSGWDEAWTPEQYRKVLRKLTGGESYGGGRCQRFDLDTPFLLSNDAHLVNPDDDTECWLGKPEAQEVLEFWRVLRWEDRSMSTSMELADEAQICDQFLARKIATMEEGSWVLRKVSDKCRFKWDVAPLYHWPKGPYTLATTNGWHIWKESKHPDEAWELMLFLSSPVYGKAIAKSNFLQPARLSLMDDYIQTLRDQAPSLKQVNLELFKEARERELGRPMELYWNQSIAEDILRPIFQQVFGLGEVGVDAIAQACDELTQRLREDKGE